MKCSSCEEDLDESRFGKYKTKEGTLKIRRECNSCRVIREGIRAKECRDKVNEYKRKYKRTHKEKIKEDERLRTHNKRIYDPQYNLKMRIVKNTRSHLFESVCERDVGCSSNNFRKWFEYLFSDDIHWQNASEWQCDHIIPLSFFDLTNEREYARASHWSNVQPIRARENRLKGNTVNRDIIQKHIKKFNDFIALNSEYNSYIDASIWPMIASDTIEQDDETFKEFLKRIIRSEAACDLAVATKTKISIKLKTRGTFND